MVARMSRGGHAGWSARTAWALLNTDPAVRLNATFSPVYPPAGSVAMSTQSGALGLAILDYARGLNIGISSFRLGRQQGGRLEQRPAPVLGRRSATPRVILLYLESFGNPRKFSQIARRVGRRKPIVAVKSGRSAAGARAASSHTGALAVERRCRRRAVSPVGRDSHRHARRSCSTWRVLLATSRSRADAASRS